MEQVLEFLKAFNVQTIISMALVIWYFSRGIKSSIDNLDRDIRTMNTRISRIEGTVYGNQIYKNIEEENK